VKRQIETATERERRKHIGNKIIRIHIDSSGGSKEDLNPTDTSRSKECEVEEEIDSHQPLHQKQFPRENNR
jgi:hypothetical protein